MVYTQLRDQNRDVGVGEELYENIIQNILN